MKSFHSKLLLLWLFLIFVFLMFYSFHSRDDDELVGWTRSTSRDVWDYVDENMQPHIFPKAFCKTKSDIEVFVLTKPSGLRNRQFIRNTWGKEFLAFNANLYFLLGETSDKYAQEIINMEDTLYQDIIQDRFVDTYNNLTLKSIMMLKLFRNHGCINTTKFLVKLDDDLIVYPENLVKRLQSIGPNPKNVLLGQVSYKTYPIRDKTSKWYLPEYLYPQDTLPDYVRGPSYVMSADVAVKLYEATWLEPLLPLEDVYLTGICAKTIGLELAHDPHFGMSNYDGKKNKCDFKSGYTVHTMNIGVDELQQLYTYLKTMDCHY